MKKIGLTGSIGSGKSEAVKFLRARGIPVHDADAAVREISDLPETFDWIRNNFPDAITDSGAINKNQLALTIFADTFAKKRLENYMHPQVAQRRIEFMNKARADGAALAVCDVPLLFETGAAKEFNETWLLVAPDDIRLARAMSRPSMTAEKFTAIDSAQMPQKEKMKLATHVVDNSGTIEKLHEKLSCLIGQI